jgi:hypothetical protein
MAGSAPYIEKTATYTIALIDYTINCTANTFTVTLPTALSAINSSFNIKNTGTGVITVACDGVETIDGETTQELVQWNNMQIQSNGVDGWIIL